MAGPTDVLSEDVKDLRESNRQLAAEIKDVFERLSVDTRESNQRLTDAIIGVARDLGDFRSEVAKDLGAVNANLERDLGNLRGEIAKDLGAINANLERDLGHFRSEVAKDLGDLRSEVAKDLGAINVNLERFQGRTEAYLSVAKWTVGAITLIVLGLIGWSYSAYARAVHIEESVVALRDIAKNQEASISKLRELHEVKRPTLKESPGPSGIGPAPPRKPDPE